MNANNQTLLDEYSLLSDNYFQKLKKESDSENWEKVRLILSQKRKDIISLIEKNIGINISDRIDFTGSPFISEELLKDDNIPKYIKDFLQGTHFLHKNGKIFSRGHSYYFLYDGLSYENNENPLKNKKAKVVDFNIKEFHSSVESHITGIFTAFKEISLMTEGDVDPEVIVKINLILLDQLKNLILFSLNFCLLYFDAQFFGRNGKRIDAINILNSEELKFLRKNIQLPTIQKEDQIYIDDKGNINYGRIINILFGILPLIENHFAAFILQKNNENVDLYKMAKGFTDVQDFQLILKYSFIYLKELFQSIETSKVGGKNFASTIRNRCLKKLVRHNREEDNFLFMLQSSIDKLINIRDHASKMAPKDEIFKTGINGSTLVLVEKSLIHEPKQLNIICPLYGGIEMPFILIAVGKIFMKGVSMNPKLIAYSYYDLKNADAGIAISEYPTLENIEPELGKVIHFTRSKVMNLLTGTWGLILDDNVYTGRTLNDFYARFNPEYPELFIATTASKTRGSKAINYEATKSLLKQVLPTSGYSIPDKNGKNGIVYSIGKRLKDFPKKG